MGCKNCGGAFGRGTAHDHTVFRFQAKSICHRRDREYSTTVENSLDSGEFCSARCLADYLTKHWGPGGDFYRHPELTAKDDWVG